MKTVPRKPNEKHKPILAHWAWLLTPLLAALVADNVNHILGLY